MICPICIIYLKCCHIRGEGGGWGGGCLEHKIVYLALRPLFLEISVTRDRSSSSTVYSSGAGLGVPGPAAATGEGAARAPAPADTTPTPPPPPPPQLRTRVQETVTAAGPVRPAAGGRAALAAVASAAAAVAHTSPGGGPGGCGGGWFGGGGAWVEGLGRGLRNGSRTLRANCTTSANPARERRRDPGRRSRRGQSLHSLGVPPSFEQWEVRAVLYLSRHARATEMWPARAENRARVNTRSRTASFARRAVHHFLAARIVQREES